MHDFEFDESTGSIVIIVVALRLDEFVVASYGMHMIWAVAACIMRGPN